MACSGSPTRGPRGFTGCLSIASTSAWEDVEPADDAVGRRLAVLEDQLKATAEESALFGSATPRASVEARSGTPPVIEDDPPHPDTPRPEIPGSEDGAGGSVSGFANGALGPATYLASLLPGPWRKDREESSLGLRTCSARRRHG